MLMNDGLSGSGVIGEGVNEYSGVVRGYDWPYERNASKAGRADAVWVVW